MASVWGNYPCEERHAFCGVINRCTRPSRCRDHKGIVRRSAKYFKYWQFLYKFNFACPKNYFPLWFHLPKKICYSGHNMILLVPYTKICYSGHNMILLVPYTKILDTTLHIHLHPSPPHFRYPHPPHFRYPHFRPPPPSLPPPTPHDVISALSCVFLYYYWVCRFFSSRKIFYFPYFGDRSYTHIYNLSFSILLMIYIRI